MKRRADAIVTRGRTLIGVRFRPQGRSRESGLDCIGAIVMATQTDPARIRRDYDFRTGDPVLFDAEFFAAGMLPVPPPAAEPGDVLLVRPAPMRLHVVLLTDLGYLHADARLRRVVEVPGAVPWPVLSAWRCPDEALVAVRLF
jgi:hypothetical protein